MFDEGIKTLFWISAEIRRCDGLFIPMMVLHKGDKDRGFVLIKQYCAGKGCIIHAKMRNADNQLIWYKPLGPDMVTESSANDYIARQLKYDEDLWVLEVEDPKAQYQPPTV